MSGDGMRRRDFMVLLGGAAAWPRAARAQQPALPVIGFLQSLSRDARRAEVAAFHSSLKEAGYVEGRNVAFEYRFADGQFDRLPALAADLVSRRVAVIAAGTQVSAVAAKAATATIPIVFTAAGDPVKLGLVASLNRPGGNVTGITNLANLLLAKNLELVHELLPAADLIAYLTNPDNPNAATDLVDMQEAARTLNVRLIVQNARSEAEIEPAFAAFVRERAGGLVVGADPLFIQLRDKLIALSARHALPATYPLPLFAQAGGLMCYASSTAEQARLAGVYVGRILKGEKPADLPVMQATKVDLVINLKTAKALGLSFPLALLGRADEVIE
jgi:putative tryptophan/tyrosine transport system substrate-binding protein